MDCGTFISLFWRQYITLEKELGNTEFYVTMNTDNQNIFSSAYIKILLEAGNQVDIVAKEYCKLLEPGSSKSTIGEYRECICTNNSAFTTQGITALHSDISIVPWDKWNIEDEDTNPNWWRVYNKLKHNRMGYGDIDGVSNYYYKFANLKNVLNAMGGLYQLHMSIYLRLALSELFYIKTPLPGSRIFTMHGGAWEGERICNSDYIFWIDDNGALQQESAAFPY